MNQITLNIWSEGASQQIPLTTKRLTIGRGEQADLRLGDAGLSRVHASINHEAGRLWALDEGSTNGTFVNGKKVAAAGIPLHDGDHLTLGDSTKIKISLTHTPAPFTPSQQQPQVNQAPASQRREGVSGWMIGAAAVGVLVILVGFGAVAKQIIDTQQSGSSPAPTPSEAVVPEPPSPPATPVPSQPTETASLTPTMPGNPDQHIDKETKLDETTESYLGNDLNRPTKKIAEARYESPNFDPNDRRKRYQQMTEAERVLYIHVKVQMVGEMVGNRPAVFPDEAIEVIKYWLDAYVRRIGSGNTRLWAEDLTFMFQRARTQFTPTIIKAFRANQAPVVVGVYIPVIETEYRNISSENFAGAAGLFQFLGPTARGYGVDPSERTNIEKMSHAAAKYIKERLGGFGADAVGVGLSIAGYNRSPRSVARDLNTILNTVAISEEELARINKSQNKDRDFWALVKEKARLDHWFQKENVQYVPRFFAAAIIGENPWDFGLKMKPLSTYSEFARD